MRDKDFKIGLKFRSNRFSSEIQVTAIREEVNQVDVVVTSSEGNAWEEKNWDLLRIKQGFEREEYIIIKPNTVNISVQ